MTKKQIEKIELIVDYIITLYKKEKEISLINTEINLKCYKNYFNKNHFIRYIEVPKQELRVYYNNELVGIIINRKKVKNDKIYNRVYDR